MKLSEVALPLVKEYLRQDGDEDDRLNLRVNSMLEGLLGRHSVNLL